MTAHRKHRPVDVLVPPDVLPTCVIPTRTNSLWPRVSSAHDTLTLPDPGDCPSHACDLVALIDNSPSVIGSGGADPLSSRLTELRLAIRHVARTCRCRRERVSLISFDQPGQATTTRQPLTRLGVRRLETALHRMPLEPGSSMLRPGLELADRVLQVAPVAVLVVLSDFLLTDADPSAAMERFLTMDAVKHAVVLGARPPGAFDMHPDISTQVVTPASEPGMVARALTGALIDARRAGDAYPQ